MVDCSKKRWVGEERFIADCPGNPHDFLVNDAACTNILMSNFAVSHHPCG
jgi:hypothetical protein